MNSSARSDQHLENRWTDEHGPQTVFGRMFDVQRRIEEKVSLAVKSGSSIQVNKVVECLVAHRPSLGISADEIHLAVVEAAARAGVQARSD